MTESRGLTILELMVVLALIAVLSGSSVLAYARLRSHVALDSAARQVVLDLKLSRIRAITRTADQRILFSAGAVVYQRQQGQAGSYRDQGPAIRLPTGVMIHDCSARDDAISFRPRGNAGTFGTVTLRNASGQDRRIIVDIAGEIRVQ